MTLINALPAGNHDNYCGTSTLRDLFLEMLKIYGIKAVGVDPEAAHIAPNIGAMKVYYKYKETH